MEFLHHRVGFTPAFAPTYDSSMASHGWSYDTTMQAAVAAANNRAMTSRPRARHIAAPYPSSKPATSSKLPSAEESAQQAARLLLDSNIAPELIDPTLLEAIKSDQSQIQATQEKLNAAAAKLLQLAERQEARLDRNEQEVSDPAEHHLGELPLSCYIPSFELISNYPDSCGRLQYVCRACR